MSCFLKCRFVAKYQTALKIVFILRFCNFFHFDARLSGKCAGQGHFTSAALLTCPNSK